jgi:SPP1 family predicted phage head-tail adaptor
MLRAGLLRHKVEIQEKATHRDSMGQEVVTWDAFGYAWASVEPLSGREQYYAQQRQASTTHKIKMRYQPGVKSYHRIKWGERFFDIDVPPLNTEERNIELILFCTEAV